MPTEFEGLLDALLAYRRGCMTDEQRAIATAPDFRARWDACQAWRARQKPDPAVGREIEAILARRPGVRP
jgi:hypothetical protein